MSRTKKTLLYIGSALPLLWTIGILTCAYFYIRHPDMVMFFIYTLIIYMVYGGLIAWIITLSCLRAFKKISTRTLVLNLLLVAAGILAAYLSLTFDVFGVSGSYID